jgi:chromosomal replication initiation ATPase DnaA
MGAVTINPRSPSPQTTLDAFDKYMRSVCSATEYTKEELCGTSRESELVSLRHLLMTIARYEFGMNTKRIGKIFNRDHSSVIYGTKTFQRHFKNKQLGFFLSGCLHAAERIYSEQWGHKFENVAK